MPLDTSHSTVDDSAVDRRAPWRIRLDERVTGRRATWAITVLIALNAIILGLETYPAIMDSPAGPPLRYLDLVIIAVFVVEIVLKLVARGWGFFRSGWNCFDFVVVAIALVPANEGLQVLRALRVLRVARLLSQVRQLRDIIESVGRAMQGMMWTGVLLGLVFYIFGVMGTQLFREALPEYFGSLGTTFITLFQVMTLDGWPNIIHPLIDMKSWAWMYFMPFILISAFIVLNLFIAIIVNATNSVAADKAREADPSAEILREVRELRAEVADLRSDRMSVDSAGAEVHHSERET